jgi:hypothetical protein
VGEREEEVGHCVRVCVCVCRSGKGDPKVGVGNLKDNFTAVFLERSYALECTCQGLFRKDYKH